MSTRAADRTRAARREKRRPIGRRPSESYAWRDSISKASRRQYNDEQRIQFVIAPHVDIGILFIFAVGSLAVYGIILGGWSSNNKYSFLGALRSSAQIISYEIPLGMSVLGVVLRDRLAQPGTDHRLSGYATAGTSSFSRWRSCCS